VQGCVVLALQSDCTHRRLGSIVEFAQLVNRRGSIRSRLTDVRCGSDESSGSCPTKLGRKPRAVSLMAQVVAPPGRLKHESGTVAAS